MLSSGFVLSLSLISLAISIILKYFGRVDPFKQEKVLDDPTLVKISEKQGKTPAQVVLRWLIQRGIVVIPKSTTSSRIIDNFKVNFYSHMLKHTSCIHPRKILGL